MLNKKKPGLTVTEGKKIVGNVLYLSCMLGSTDYMLFNVD